MTNILTRQEYCGDVVNFKTTKHFRDKHNHYVDRSQWHITENVHEPIISRSDFETAQRILENAPVRRPNGDGEIHPLSGLLFCKDCGAKMHIRIDYRNGGKRHVAFCSEYHKGKAKNPKCHSPHIMDADLLMQTIAEVLKKIEDYSISNRAEFEALVKKNLAMQQTDQTKKQQKRIPQITTRLEQIDNLKLSEQPETSIGKYGRMRKSYLKEHRPILYNHLLMSEKLYPHLLEIDRTAQERVDTMLPHMMETAGVTEELKACDPMRWVGLMNTLTAQIEEILIRELICS